jgi:methenyltetrahydromethanopterin cyclohydrolase
VEKWLLDYVLIVASSGRMLAQAARKTNLVPLVIDLFADQDTQEIAEKVIQLKDFSLPSLQREVVKLLTEFNFKSIIYGSGLENQLKSLAWLKTQAKVHGNTADVNAQYLDNKSLFKNLDRLNIAYPKVSFASLSTKQPYLIKSSKVSGGQGIKLCTNEIRKGEYYQQYKQGESGSILFLAAKQGTQIIGFHRQWTLSRSNFSFAKIIKQNILPLQQTEQVIVWVNKLVKTYDLKGLGSLDFIWDGQQCYFLEVNCRPPASMILYPELDLLNAHMTEKFVLGKVKPTIRGLQILYATSDCWVELSKWPSWSFDRPQKKVGIKSGQPICSIMADGKTVRQVEKNLKNRQKIIQNNVIK